MNHANVNFAGRYKLTATKPDGTQRVLSDWFNNLVLLNGLNRIGTGGIMSMAHVGSGSSAPAFGESLLSNLIGTSENVPGADITGTNLGEGYAYCRRTFRFPAGTATGNISEVGVGWASNQLFSRALVKDGAGDPTTVTVLADEVLDLVYELRVYWPTTDNTTTVTLGGVGYSVTVRASDVDQWATGTSMFAYLLANGVTNGLQDVLGYNGSLGTITEGPGGDFVGRPAVKTFDGSYSNNSQERNMKLVAGLGDITESVSAFNVICPLGVFKMGFTPPIPKTGSNILTINFRLSWAQKEI